MHIEPGLVDSSKIALSYVTAGAVSIYTIKQIAKDALSRGVVSLALRMVISTAMVFSFFQIMPHYSAGVSEVHFIFGSTLFLLFGSAPAAVGMAAGLFLQGALFEPIDLPQFGMNVTTLIAPLLLVSGLANKIVSPNTAYVDLTYRQTFALSSVYQAGIVSWVSFWVILGQGMSMATVSSLATFASAYVAVIMVEPLVDAVVLNTAKTLKKNSAVFSYRLYS
ncbi:cobalt transporter [Vibrio natriegens]|uniref:energy-coupling factor ABC transporter permease n=1 Tax=Vibrio natriegens TaxID=691 RepID=UPI000804235E|nr:energy-coupling factor ABC transporter permease [Vibrio natriegens]ANQ23776.1 cobalt transporter [Vibrio natriegens]MCY9876923.1 energy-coupling factor ABC transporter permease [Vibrio natriegens]